MGTQTEAQKRSNEHISRIGPTGLMICSCGWSFRSTKRNGYAIANQRNGAFAKHLQEIKKPGAAPTPEP